MKQKRFLWPARVATLAMILALVLAGCGAPAAAPEAAPAADEGAAPAESSGPVVNSIGVELPADAAPASEQVIRMPYSEYTWMTWDASVYD